MRKLILFLGIAAMTAVLTFVVVRRVLADPCVPPATLADAGCAISTTDEHDPPVVGVCRGNVEYTDYDEYVADGETHVRVKGAAGPTGIDTSAGLSARYVLFFYTTEGNGGPPAELRKMGFAEVQIWGSDGMSIVNIAPNATVTGSWPVQFSSLAKLTDGVVNQYHDNGPLPEGIGVNGRHPAGSISTIWASQLSHQWVYLLFDFGADVNIAGVRVFNRGDTAGVPWGGLNVALLVDGEAPVLETLRDPVGDADADPRNWCWNPDAVPLWVECLPCGEPWSAGIQGRHYYTPVMGACGDNPGSVCPQQPAIFEFKVECL